MSLVRALGIVIGGLLGFGGLVLSILASLDWSGDLSLWVVMQILGVGLEMFKTWVLAFMVFGFLLFFVSLLWNRGSGGD